MPAVGKAHRTFPRRRTTTSRRTTTLAALLALAASTTAHAADYTFTGVGNWSTASNWLNDLVPVNGPTTHIILSPTTLPFSSAANNSRPSWILNGLTINNGSASAANTLAISSSSSLRFEGPSPYIESRNLPTTITGPLFSDSQLTLRLVAGVAGSSAYTVLSGSLDAPGLLLTGGAFALAGNNTLPAGISVTQNASLRVDSPSAFGTGGLVVDYFQTSSGQLLLGLQVTGSSTTYTTPISITAGSGNASAQMIFRPANSQINYDYFFPSLAASGNVILSGVVTGLATGATVHFQSVTLSGNASFGERFTLSNVTGSGAITSSGTLTLGTANTYAGGTSISGGILYANATGALSNGSVALGFGGSLALNATAAANADIFVRPSDVNGGTLFYNASGAAGGHLLTARDIRIGDAVTSLGGDSFSLPSNGYLTGNSSTLSLFTRDANLFLAPGATIESTDSALPATNNLGVNADLTLALHTVSATTVTVGVGTPWAAIAGGKAGAFVGVITPNSAFSLASGALGSGVAASFNITAPTPVIVSATGAALNSPLSNYSGVLSFNVVTALTLASANALGGGASTAPVPVHVAAGATLTLGHTAALNGTLLLHNGAILVINAPGLTGTGAISRDPDAAVTFNVQNPGAFIGPQLTPASVAAGDTVLLNASNIVNLSALTPAATYAFYPADFTTQSDGLELDGGTLRLGAGAYLAPSSASSKPIHIGSLGATFQTFAQFIPLPFQPAYTADFALPIVADGPLTIGTNDRSTGNGAGVALSGTNSLSAVMVNNAALSAIGPSSLGNAQITLNNSILQLTPRLPVAPAVTSPYTINLTVISSSILADAGYLTPQADVSFSLRSTSLLIDKLTLAAPLTLDLFLASATFSTLHLTADATLASTGRFGSTTLSALTADGTPRALTLKGSTHHASFQITGPIQNSLSLLLDNATLLLVAPQDPGSATAFSINASSTLDFAANYDLSSPNAPTLSGDGLIIIDANTTLILPIDSAFSGSIQILGTLVLTPPLNSANTNLTPNFTLFPAPEPASLSLLALALPLLLHRRR